MRYSQRTVEVCLRGVEAGCSLNPIAGVFTVFRSCMLLCLLSSMCAPFVHGQSSPFAGSSSSLLAADSAEGTSGAAIISTRTQPAETRPLFFSSVAVGVNAGVLGIGAETAIPLSQHFNLRAGGHFFNFNDALSTDGVNYTANLRLRSAQTSVDWFPWARSFHVSAGALLFNGNRITANALIPGGSSFTLNGTSYISGATDPVHGAGSVRFGKAAPMLTAGWGNLLSREGRHFSFPFEAGFAYTGDPKTSLGFTGTVCYDYQGTPECESIASDPMVQANILAEQNKLAHDASYARFFPVLSTGFGYRF